MGAKRAAEEAEKAAKAAAENEKCNKIPLCMWRQTGGCKSDGDREATHDKPCNETVPKGTSGFCDCDGDGVKGEAEPGYDCSGEARKCCDVCLPSEATVAETTAPAEDDEEPDDPEAEGEEKPQVSEYSKWMDGAEEKLAEKDEEMPQVSEYSKWMDGAEEKLADKTDGEIKSTDASAAEAAATPPKEEPKQKTAVELE